MTGTTCFVNSRSLSTARAIRSDYGLDTGSPARPHQSFLCSRPPPLDRGRFLRHQSFHIPQKCRIVLTLCKGTGSVLDFDDGLLDLILARLAYFGKATRSFISRPSSLASNTARTRPPQRERSICLNFSISVGSESLSG